MKVHLRENTKGVAKQPFDKEINQQYQQEAISYYPRRWKNNPKVNSEIIRAVPLITGSEFKFQWTQWFQKRGAGIHSAEPAGTSSLGILYSLLQEH